MSVWLEIFPSRLCIEYRRDARARVRTYTRACNCRGRSSTLLSPPPGLLATSRVASRRVASHRPAPCRSCEACPIDRVWEHDIARMSYDPYSKICIPIHYAPVELKIGTQRGATDRALHGTSKEGGSRNDKSKTSCPACLPSLPFSPSPPPRPTALQVSLFANHMQIALALMANDATARRKKEARRILRENFPRAISHFAFWMRGRDTRCIAHRRPCAQMY